MWRELLTAANYALAANSMIVHSPLFATRAAIISVKMVKYSSPVLKGALKTFPNALAGAAREQNVHR
jgi:hypothetical protein